MSEPTMYSLRIYDISPNLEELLEKVLIPSDEVGHVLHSARNLIPSIESIELLDTGYARCDYQAWVGDEPRFLVVVEKMAAEAVSE